MFIHPHRSILFSQVALHKLPHCSPFYYSDTKYHHSTKQLSQQTLILTRKLCKPSTMLGFQEQTKTTTNKKKKKGMSYSHDMNTVEIWNGLQQKNLTCWHTVSKNNNLVHCMRSTTWHTVSRLQPALFIRGMVR